MSSNTPWAGVTFLQLLCFSFCVYMFLWDGQMESRHYHLLLLHLDLLGFHQLCWSSFSRQKMEGDGCFSGNPSASCLFLFDSCSTSFFLASLHSRRGVTSSLIASPHPPQHNRVLRQRSVEPVHIQASLQHCVRGITKVCEFVSWGCHTMIQLWVQHLVYTQCT